MSMVALHAPGIAHQLDRGLKFLAERGPSPERQVCVGQRLEARHAAKDDVCPSMLSLDIFRMGMFWVAAHRPQF